MNFILSDNNVLFITFKKYGDGWVAELSGMSDDKKLEPITENLSYQFQPTLKNGKPAVGCLRLIAMDTPAPNAEQEEKL